MYPHGCHYRPLGIVYAHPECDHACLLQDIPLCNTYSAESRNFHLSDRVALLFSVFRKCSNFILKYVVSQKPVIMGRGVII